MTILVGMVNFWHWFWKTLGRACEIKEVKDAQIMRNPQLQVFNPYEPSVPSYSLVMAFFDAMNEEDEAGGR